MTKRNKVKLVLAIYYIVAILFFGWIIVSIFNIGFNTSMPEQVQNIWTWNFFGLIFG